MSDGAEQKFDKGKNSNNTKLFEDFSLIEFAAFAVGAGP